jgi:REP element-mobilizing transposase RayT
MRFDSGVHHRRSIRLSTFDYRGAGAYFVTICTHERAIVFDDPRMRRAIELALQSVGRYCRPASVDEFVVMPNHVHAIIWIAGNDRIPVRGVGAQHTPSARRPHPIDDRLFAESHSRDPCAAPLRGRPGRRVESASLGAVVRAFKSATAKRINAMRNTPGAPVWQRNYHEHIIRGDHDLARVRQYIRDNPVKWADDPDNPANIPTAS